MEIIIGIATALLTQLAKNHPSIPLSSGNAAAIRAVVAILAIVGTVLTALVEGKLASLDFQSIVGEAITAATIFFAATGFHGIFLRSKTDGK